MFYWVIPYLVAYNLSEPATDWQNGPVHTFEAAVNLKTIGNNGVNFHTDVQMTFECKPVVESSIKCQVKNPALVKYQIKDNNETHVEETNPEWCEEFGAINFDIEFDRIGIKNLTFPEPLGYYREMAIRSIFNNLHVGIDLTDKNFGHYDAMEKSLYGDCPTKFHIKEFADKLEDGKLFVKSDVAVGELMIVPFFNKYTNNQTILIEKYGTMTECLNKKPYIFGNDQPSGLDRKIGGFFTEFDMTHSRSEIYMAGNRFNSFTEHTGTFIVGIRSKNLVNLNTTMMEGTTTEKIRLSLRSILPDKFQ